MRTRGIKESCRAEVVLVLDACLRNEHVKGEDGKRTAIGGYSGP
jgi:hypothetical protein